VEDIDFSNPHEAKPPQIQPHPEKRKRPSMAAQLDGIWPSLRKTNLQDV